MSGGLGARLRRAAGLAFAIHLLAGLAMVLVLRFGLDTNPDLSDRLRFVAGHRLSWSAAWMCWTAAALAILNFYARLAAVLRASGVRPGPMHAAVALTVIAVGADWGAQAVEVLVLPPLAGSGDAPSFLSWHRMAVLLTGFLANGLYTISASLLVWASRRHYPRWVRMAGFGVVAGGSILSAAAACDAAGGMALANVVLVPCLLVWLAGVAKTPPPAPASPASIAFRP